MTRETTVNGQDGQELTEPHPMAPVDKSQRRGLRPANRVTDAAPKEIPAGELWSLKQVAGYLGISVEYARREWVRWIDEGVNPIRLNGKSKGALRFLKSEIVALTERWRVQQA